jgi:hypothetical protein
MQAAVAQGQDALGTLGERRVVGDDHETRLPRTIERQHQLENAGGGLPIEIAGRLVGEHAGRLGDQRARDRRPLPLASRQLRRGVPQTVPESDLAEHGRSARFCLGFRHAPDVQRHGDVLQRGELGEQVMKLIDETQKSKELIVNLRQREEYLRLKQKIIDRAQQ